MCNLCNKIYTEDIFGTEEDTRDLRGDIYIKKYHFCNNNYYKLCQYRFDIDPEDEVLMEINYCPKCGKQLFFDNNYYGTVLNNPKVKIIKIKNNI